MASEEPLQATGAQSIYVRPWRHYIGIRLLHHFPAFLLQRTPSKDCLIISPLNPPCHSLYCRPSKQEQSSEFYLPKEAKESE